MSALPRTVVLLWPAASSGPVSMFVTPGFNLAGSIVCMTVYHTNVSSLHITNGSCAGDKLKTFVDGQLILMMDVLHEGPAPLVDDATWYETRARFLGAPDESKVADIREGLARSD